MQSGGEFPRQQVRSESVGEGEVKCRVMGQTQCAELHCYNIDTHIVVLINELYSFQALSLNPMFTTSV